ncbi:alpha/beta fold hydrolase [Arthrobacter sp. MDB2-24]
MSGAHAGSGSSGSAAPASMSSTADEGFLRVDGIRVRYRDEGAREKPPVLLLHGIGRSLEDWEGLYGRLAPAHRVLSVDLPGFGLSERTEGRYSMESMARFVLAALDTLSEHRPLHVVGNSLGGAVAMKISALEPQRVRSLVLVNSAGFGKEVTLALRILAVRPIGRRLLKDKSRKAAYRTERSLFYDKRFVTEERLDHAQEVGRNPGYDDVLLAVARHLGTVRGVRRRWRTQLLRTVAAQRKPTLVVWGDEDRVLPASHLEHARAVFPHAEFHLFEKCGHMPQIEREEEFDALVRQFISGVEAQGSGGSSGLDTDEPSSPADAREE